jgi:hypothetical protein
MRGSGTLCFQDAPGLYRGVSPRAAGCLNLNVSAAQRLARPSCRTVLFHGVSAPRCRHVIFV